MVIGDRRPVYTRGVYSPVKIGHVDAFVWYPIKYLYRFRVRFVPCDVWSGRAYKVARGPEMIRFYYKLVTVRGLVEHRAAQLINHQNEIVLETRLERAFTTQGGNLWFDFTLEIEHA